MPKGTKTVGLTRQFQSLLQKIRNKDDIGISSRKLIWKSDIRSQNVPKVNNKENICQIC